MENQILVKALNKRHTVLEKRILLNSKKVLKYIKRKGLLVEVFIVSDKRIRNLNFKFRAKDTPTNVLSFELKDWPAVDSNRKRVKPIGEVYLAPDYIRRENESLERLLTHGILHLLGYDHKRKGDSIRMENLEKRVFRRFGF